ncbi:HlyD family secretion protein [Enterobacter kobei]|uniref:HlyD family secretion protein n=1 Tax=Enterobacter kobei TaxID=208224 RepID=UPI0021BF2BEE|nr:HlyD family secretion protein [Enterobacter kobei]UXJ66656.1 HlyD family secretion protein [Enterobacter kobei]
MDLLLVLTYAAICFAIFKFFHIPLNKWTIPTAVLGGVIIISTLIFLMNYNHPYSEMARSYYVSTPIVPLVKGRVDKVSVTNNQHIKQGEVLFSLDPEPFKQQKDSLQAQLLAEKERLLSFQARLRSAQLDLGRIRELVGKGFGVKRDLDANVANVDDLRAQTNAQVLKIDQVTAQLRQADYDLKQTTVLAPTDGYVLQLALRPGMIATPYLYRPTMTFVHASENYFIGWFWQNSMQRLNTGDEAEVVVDGVPGKIFKGRVKSVIPAISAGNVQANSALIDQSSAKQADRIAVAIEIIDPEWNKYQMIAGESGQAAIYTHHFHHVSVMRKILLRMASWLNYIFPFH